MFDRIKETIQELFRSRAVILGTAFVALFLVLVGRCFQLQIVKGEDYLNQYTLSIQKTREVKGTRGNIYDKNGKVLAYNELAYSITIEDNGSYDTRKEKNQIVNDTITTIIKIVESNKDTVINDFGIVLNQEGNYTFVAEEGTARQRFIADVYGEAKIDNLTKEQKNSTAQDIIDYLCEDKVNGYGINQKTTDKNDVLKLVNVRYAMGLKSYQKYIPTTVAEDVSDETVAMIMENSDSLQGVEVAEESLRKYNDPEYFASLLGYTGTISESEYNNYVDQGITSYSLTDIIGKAGLEQSMDSVLQGTKGKEKLYVNSVGKIIGSVSSTKAVAGNDLYLTIDSDLQKAAYNILEEKLAGIVLNKLQNTLTFDATKVGDSSEIMIPVGDVYNAFFDNEILNTTHFKDDNAGTYEKEISTLFDSRETANTKDVIAYVSASDGVAYKELSKEMQAYIYYISSTLLKDSGILLTDSIDTEDTTYQAWTKDESISLYAYLNYAISKNWIDTTKLQDYMGENGAEYSNSNETYAAIVSYLEEHLPSNSGYQKLIYKYMIRNGELTGRQICLAAYEQNVFTFDQNQYDRLISGSLGSYDFIRGKIETLELTPGQLALEPCSGSLVITDPSTGEVRAMVSYPGYDNNRLANVMDSDYYNKLVTDKASPFYNHATQEKTAPGSTFKMVSAVAGLTEGVITGDTTITCTGVFEKVEPNLRCWIYPESHGSLTVTQGIQNSCNSFFSEVGYRLGLKDQTNMNKDDKKGTKTAGAYSSDEGIKKLQKYATMFGLNQTSGVEIPETDPQMSDTASVPSAIGQGTHNYTTSQLARYVTAVANSGEVYNISLVDKVEDVNGKVVKDYSPELINEMSDISSNTWALVHQGMINMIRNNSTFTGIGKLGLTVAGKTGTAQQSKTHPDHALFVGYASKDSSESNTPELAMSVRIANGYKSSYAAEVGRDVIKYYFKVDDEGKLVTGKAASLGESNVGD